MTIPAAITAPLMGAREAHAAAPPKNKDRHNVRRADQSGGLAGGVASGVGRGVVASQQRGEAFDLAKGGLFGLLLGLPCGALLLKRGAFLLKRGAFPLARGALLL